MLTELILTTAGPLSQRGERALDRLSAGYVSAGLFRQSHQPLGHDPGLVGVAVRSAAAHAARGGQGLLGPRAACAATWPKRTTPCLVDRKEIKVHQSPVDLMLREIGTTHSLILFPEGGRTTGETVGEFKSGLYYLSKKRPDLELVPVHIDNMNRVLPRGEFLPVPLLSCITFGPPMWLEAGESKVDFLNRARQAVQRLKEVE